MRGTTVKRWGPRRPAGQKSGSGGRGAVAVDRLSVLPDALLHHIMSSLKAWEVVRTCVLARRWRHLWESAPCVDIRVRYSGRDDEPPEQGFLDFVHRLFLLRDVSAPVDTLRLRSSDEDAGFDENDANIWIRVAINRRARVIHLVGHHKEIASLDHVRFVSRHLKILKLSYARLDRRILQQLPSGCTSLEELDLKDCLVTGHEIVSASLKTLIMVKCRFNLDFSIAAPNLMLLRLVTPYVRVPSFKNFGSLVTGTIILDDFYLSDDYEHISDKDDCDDTTDDDGDDSDANYRTQIHKVVLSRELKMCPTFTNLKTLSLGEWCMTADFDALIFLLQHSPNIERLYLQLKLNFGTRKALETGIKPMGRSFTCKDLRMVKIKCSKDDARVHTLAHMFKANGVALEKIYVRRSGNAHLRGQKFMKELARQELVDCGMLDDYM